MRFTTTVLQARKTATGLPVPPEVIEALGAGKRPAVVVTLDGGYTYRSTVGVMGAQSLVPLSAAHREAARVQAGDTVEVTLEVDTTPRTVAVPDDLAAALDAAGVRAAFETLSNSRQRAVVDPVLAAKAPETRARRVAKAVESLRA
ncbi:YdeI/OmpD-associated family protein [Curtobacterium sp. B8]|uniref:YdeI/OmpD-associated family protein n=1 Tax=Curtobacterium sp. B8 TaxID=95611 RepID=UPI0003489108|nr:YdeI/OmpD-associated family protein [Curtobacterium sp. B8]